MNDSAGMIIHFIQKSLSEGKIPDNDGFYVFTRKEMAEGAGVSLSTVSNNMWDVTDYFKTHCNFKTWAKYEEFPNEVLYVDVGYDRGKLKFKRNPLTFNPELAHLWALPPLHNHFTYDYFDNNHRRK